MTVSLSRVILFDAISNRSHTSYLPLTTVYTPSSTCFSGPWTGGGTAGITTIHQQAVSDGFSYISLCYPSNFYSVDGYSPGICPFGYTTAYKTVLSSSVTSAQCCPSSYEGFGDDAGAGLGGCSRLYSTSTSIECSYATDATTCVPGTVGPGVAEKFAVHVFYQQTDLHLFPAGYSPGEPTITLTRPNLSATTASSSPSETSSSVSETGRPSAFSSGSATGSTLSTGAKAGIGVGVTLAIVLVLVALLLLLVGRKRRAHEQGHNPDEPELEANEKRGPPELDGAEKTVQELDVKPAKTGAELGSAVRTEDTKGTAELEAQKIISNIQRADQRTDRAGIAELDSQPDHPSQGQAPHELAGFPARPPLPELDGSHMEVRSSANSPLTQTGSGLGGLSGTASGPVSATLEDETNHPSTAAASLPTAADSGTQSSSNAVAATENVSSSAPMTTSIEELELQYLESEERRIRERKEAILRGQLNG